jgi:putative ABC transport system permease protein
MGFTRPDVFFFPIYQGATLALLGVAIAIAAYAALSKVINHAFSDDLDLGQRICVLPPESVSVAVAIVLTVALMAASLAAWATTGIEPSEAIREE